MKISQRTRGYDLRRRKFWAAGRPSRVAGSGLLLALALYSCGTAETADSEATDTGTTPEASTTQTADDPLAELVAAAEEEGEVFWYNGDSTLTDPVTEAFEAKYDIEVTALRLPSGELMSRFTSESEAGTFEAEVLGPVVAPTSVLSDLIDEGYLLSLEDSELPAYSDFPEDAKLPDAGTALVRSVPWVLAYNTDLVSEGDVPTSWSDLSNERWSGQIGMISPEVAASYATFWDLLREEHGDQLLTDIAAQDPLLFPSLNPGLEALAGGEISLTFPATPTNIAVLQEEGAPIASAVLSPTNGNDQFAHVAANARNPNAARLLVNFFLSEEGNKLIEGDSGAIGPYSSGGEGVPSDYRIASFDNIEERTSELVSLLGLD